MNCIYTSYQHTHPSSTDPPATSFSHALTPMVFFSFYDSFYPPPFFPHTPPPLPYVTNYILHFSSLLVLIEFLSHIRTFNNMFYYLLSLFALVFAHAADTKVWSSIWFLYFDFIVLLLVNHTPESRF